MSEKIYKLDDSVIAHIARALQVSMLTGTDIVDYIRMIRLASTDSESLVLENEYSKIFDVSIDKMIENVKDKE
jgi:hypothetical protein